MKFTRDFRLPLDACHETRAEQRSDRAPRDADPTRLAGTRPINASMNVGQRTRMNQNYQPALTLLKTPPLPNRHGQSGKRGKMKIQCNACEMAEAIVLCCADEAALCLACDERIHAANKLASKHLRVPLSNSSQMPKCDICQETTGYFFCLEDRALLCRKCDVAIHTANAHVSVHQRFLLTGVKVGLEPKEPVVSSAREKKNYMEKASEIPSGTSKSRSLSSANKNAASSQAVVNESLSASKVSFSGGSTSGFIPDWHLGEFFGFNDFNNSYGLMGQVSSKEDDGVKLGDSEWSPVYPAVAEDVDIEDYLGQVPELPWTVPEIPSPPTASGLHWPRNVQCNLSDDSLLFVPDVCHFANGSRNQLHIASAIPNPIPNPKRRRQF